MKTPSECMGLLKKKIKKEWKIAFVSAFFLGLLIHLPAWFQDVPNHDGLASVYFDQNMITSGRWFLTVACGLSSYFTLPWLIGLLSLVWLSITAVLLVELLQVARTEWIVIISGLLVSFPALASTYAYIFTADGYMLALLLAVLAVLLTKKYPKGFLAGGICLAFSLGTYQAYLSFCILLCMYALVQEFLDDKPVKNKITSVIKYLGMGIIGAGLYFIILQLLLKMQGKVLDTYQGISDMTAVGKAGLTAVIRSMYEDFVIFICRGNILFNNVFSLFAVLVLGVLLLWAVFHVVRRRRLYKSPFFWGTFILFLLLVPLAANVILYISPQVGYHLLMRYQYVLLLILSVAFISNYGFPAELPIKDAEADAKEHPAENKPEHTSKPLSGNAAVLTQWGLLLGGVVLCFNFAVSMNIGYSNLHKRYEKTYAYCLRLADRIEQTEGYYQGMPVVIMGIVGDENFPPTDVTEAVTGNMIGLCGDYLCYNGQNYKDFFKHYLGITIEIADQETVGGIYNTSSVYQSLDSFPGKDCTRVVDGVLYVKTENQLAPEDWPDTVITE